MSLHGRVNRLLAEDYGGDPILWPHECHGVLLEFEDAVSCEGGAVVTRDGTVVAPHPYHTADGYTSDAPEFEHVVALQQYGGANYWHLVIEALSRLAWTDGEVLRGAVVAVSHAPAFVAEYLELLGVPRDRLVVGTTRGRRVYLPVYEPYRFVGEPPREAVLVLRTRVLQTVGAWRTTSTRRALFARRGSSGREAPTVFGVADALSAAGYDVREVVWDGMSARQQVREAQAAAVYFGCFGANMLNSVWCSTDTPIIEVFSDEYPYYSNYWHLSACVGRPYASVFTEGGVRTAIDAVVPRP